VDGSSATFYTVNHKKWGFKKLVFGVCSRNIAVGKGNNNYWNVAQKYDLQKKMLALKKNKLVIQGECAGGKIQGNKYKIEGLELFVFNVIENGRRYTLDEMVKFCDQMGLKTVPIIQRDWRIFFDVQAPEAVKRVVGMSIGKSVLYDVQREGLVFRLVDDPRVSFKAINPEFLLKFGDGD
jgi:ATP-dependent RNA circularization protein (DNA/RNA ligase family)